MKKVNIKLEKLSLEELLKLRDFIVANSEKYYNRNPEKLADCAIAFKKVDDMITNFQKDGREKNL